MYKLMKGLAIPLLSLHTPARALLRITIYRSQVPFPSLRLWYDNDRSQHTLSAVIPYLW